MVCLSLDSNLRLEAWADIGSTLLSFIYNAFCNLLSQKFSLVSVSPGVLGTQVGETARGGSHQGSNDYPSAHLRLCSPVSD